MITGNYPNLRLRRNRKQDWARRLVQENTLSPNDFILPVFLIDGSNKKEPIKSMPDVYRYSINRLSQIVDKALNSKIPMVAIFPKTKTTQKPKRKPRAKKPIKVLEIGDKVEDKLPEPIFDEDHAQDQVIAQIFTEEPIESKPTNRKQRRSAKKRKRR